MFSILLKYKILPPLIFFLLLFFTSFSQETKQDSIVLVNKYQNNAGDALKNQDFETAIINLNKANKFLTSSTDTLLKAEVLLGLAELNYYLQNFDKARVETNNAISLLKADKKNEEKLALAYNLYGFILTKLNDFKESEKYLKEADNIFTKLGDEKNQANVILTRIK